jgi:NAD(P)-dependent dehydrogenase (short-subunit alcohol dehydrogenase family)
LRTPIGSMKVQFRTFIPVGAPVALRIASESRDALKLELWAGELATSVIAIAFTPRSAESSAPLSHEVVASPGIPMPLASTDIAGRAGRLPGRSDGAIAAQFPRLTDDLGPERVEAIALLSTLVGMVCPGLHSIFSQLAIRFTAENAAANGLSFRVRSFDERFRSAQMEVAGSGILGTVTAFARLPPVRQPVMAEFMTLVKAGEFRATTALIVGGSRGLGAVTAKFIAAGGGRVVVSYAVGKSEAEGVLGEIAAACGPDACRILPYEVRKNTRDQLAAIDWRINHVYYFATPHIFQPAGAVYSPARLNEFLRFYVDGFYAVCTGLHDAGAAELRAFYPSSVAIEECLKGMTEYVMAKLAGERLCADMNRFVPGMRVAVSRLPRILTDQTASVVPVESQDALEVMLPLIRQMHEA